MPRVYDFQNLICWPSVGLLGCGIGPSQGPCLRRTTQTEETYMSMTRLDWKPWSQCLSDRKQYMCGHCDQYGIISVTVSFGGLDVAEAVSRWLPTAAARVRVRAGMWDLLWIKRHCGKFSPSISVSPANHHSTNFSVIIITRGWHNRPIGGCSAKCTQLDSTSYYTNLKKPHHIILCRNKQRFSLSVMNS
jgi:hypothetical protein